MANQVEQQLMDDIFQKLQQERFATFITIDHETGGPNISAVSWVFARDKKTIYVSVDNRSRIVQNIIHQNKVVLTTIVNGSIYSISGTAHVKKEKLEGVPLKLALIEINILEVRDVMFYGSKILENIKYEKTYDQKAAAKLDLQVMAAMKKA